MSLCRTDSGCDHEVCLAHNGHCAWIATTIEVLKRVLTFRSDTAHGVHSPLSAVLGQLQSIADKHEGVRRDTYNVWWLHVRANLEWSCLVGIGSGNDCHLAVECSVPCDVIMGLAGPKFVAKSYGHEGVPFAFTLSFVCCSCRASLLFPVGFAFDRRLFLEKALPSSRIRCACLIRDIRGFVSRLGCSFFPVSRFGIGYGSGNVLPDRTETAVVRRFSGRLIRNTNLLHDSINELLCGGDAAELSDR